MRIYGKHTMAVYTLQCALSTHANKLHVCIRPSVVVRCGIDVVWEQCEYSPSIIIAINITLSADGISASHQRHCYQA